MNRRKALQSLGRIGLGLFGLSRADCATPPLLQRPFVGPPRPTLDERVASITTLKFEDLRRTPLKRKNITVFYEVERHPEVQRDLLASALPYVRQFYDAFLGVAINFTPVDHVDETKIDKRTTFGLRYLSPDRALEVVSDFATNPKYFSPAERAVRCPDGTCVETRETVMKDFLLKLKLALTFKNVEGFGLPIPGMLIFYTPRDLSGHYQIYQTKRDNDRKKLEDQLKQEGHDPARATDLFPPDLTVRLRAQALCHELGHLLSLFHPFNLPGSIPDVYPGRPFKKLSNFMSYNLPYETDPVTGDMLRLSIDAKTIPLGCRSDRLQVHLVHNYLAGGIVFRTLQELGGERYFDALAEANGLGRVVKDPVVAEAELHAPDRLRETYREEFKLIAELRAKSQSATPPIPATPPVPDVQEVPAQ